MVQHGWTIGRGLYAFRPAGKKKNITEKTSGRIIIKRINNTKSISGSRDSKMMIGGTCPA